MQATDKTGSADYLNLSVAAVSRRINNGTFPPPDIHENGTDWWDLATLDKWKKKVNRRRK